MTTPTHTKLLTAGELTDTLDQLDPDTIITWPDLDDNGDPTAAGITRIDADGNADIGYLHDTETSTPDWDAWLNNDH